MLTVETFAAVASCLAHKLDSTALGTALAALAPLISARAEMRPPPQPASDHPANPTKSRSRRSCAKSRHKRTNSPRGVNSNPGAFARACAIFAADRTLKIKALMAAANCGSGTAILARRHVRQQANEAPSHIKSNDTQREEIVIQPPQSPTPTRQQSETREPGPPTALSRAREFLEQHLKVGPRMEIHVRAAANLHKISPGRARQGRRRPGNPAEGLQPRRRTAVVLAEGG
jgi:hypothetical protein